MPNGSVEFIVSGEFAAEFFDEGFSKLNCVTFNDDVKVVDRFTKQRSRTKPPTI